MGITDSQQMFFTLHEGKFWGFFIAPNPNISK